MDTKMTAPKVSIVMPVYNAEHFLREAIESILKQTFVDFECIIVDDASTDSSVSIVESYDDPRIYLMRNKENHGSAYSMNRGMEAARGIYIARMDADDVSLPTRLQEQVGFLDAHPRVGVVGSNVEVIGDDHTYVWSYYTSPDDIKASLLFQCSMAFPTVMMRKSMLDRHGIRFDETSRRAEDYDLWERCSNYFDLANIGKVLLKYRIHPGQTSAKFQEHHADVKHEVHLRQLQKIGLQPTPEELQTHIFAADYFAPQTQEVINNIDAWFTKLWQAVDKTGIYQKQNMSAFLGFLWYALLVRNLHMGSWVLELYKTSPQKKHLTMQQRAKFRVKYFFKNLF